MLLTEWSYNLNVLSISRPHHSLCIKCNVEHVCLITFVYCGHIDIYISGMDCMEIFKIYLIHLFIKLFLIYTLANFHIPQASDGIFDDVLFSEIYGLAAEKIVRQYKDDALGLPQNIPPKRNRYESRGRYNNHPRGGYGGYYGSSHSSSYGSYGGGYGGSYGGGYG